MRFFSQYIHTYMVSSFAVAYIFAVIAEVDFFAVVSVVATIFWWLLFAFPALGLLLAIILLLLMLLYYDGFLRMSSLGYVCHCSVTFYDIIFPCHEYLPCVAGAI